MNRKVWALVGLIILSLILFGSGMVVGRMGWNQGNQWEMMGNGYFSDNSRMGNGYQNNSMMNGSMTNGYMMDGAMMSNDMMGFANGSLSANVEPLSLAEAEAAVEKYLAGFDNDGFEIGEIMIFENHAYAQVVEKESGIGAMELLIDPVTLAVSPEPGPNMMWNLRYSPMAEAGMMGMMAGFGNSGPDSAKAMSVTATDALAAAQRYLDTQLPGTEVEATADPFYGYYTLHILSAGETIGMLSVNGYTGEVFLHTWHGDFVTMSDDNH